MSYLAPAGSARFEQEIKRSRFIGQATEVGDEDEVQHHLRSLKREHPAATHHCWAYVLGDPRNSTRLKAEDDGEPAGTAGRPILNVLQRKGVGDALVVVVRYFGGVKLGAGGLVRAYSGTANRTVEALSLEEKGSRHDAWLVLDYADEPRIKAVLDALDVSIVSVDYAELVTLRVRLPAARLKELRRELADRTHGRGRLELDDDPESP